MKYRCPRAMKIGHGLLSGATRMEAVPMTSENFLSANILRLSRLIIAAGLIAVASQSAGAQDQRAGSRVDEGKKIFDTVGGVGCKTCHGAFGEGKVGPANRGVNEATVREALEKIPSMLFLRDLSRMSCISIGPKWAATLLA